MTGDDVRTQRWLVLGLTLSTTAVATARLLDIFRVDGMSALAGILTWATSKPRWGIGARGFGLFLVPSERAGVPVVDRFDELLAANGWPRLRRYRRARS